MPPKTKNNPEINRRNHKRVNTNRKGTNLNIYDRYSHGGQEKISQGYNPLGSILKRRLPNQPQTRINTNIQTILNIHIPI